MKKYLILLFTVIFLASCSGDRLLPIRRLARSENLDKKTEASLLYKDAIKTLIEAYSSSAGLNKDIGTRLMNMGAFEKAVEHFKIAASIKNNDKVIYHNLGICYVNLYKIQKNSELLSMAEDNYKIALNLAPDSKGTLYDYAQLLVFGTENYSKAIEVLNHYLYDLGTKDKDGYFLLGRSYYAIGENDKAFTVFNSIYEFEKTLTAAEKEKLGEFIALTSTGASRK